MELEENINPNEEEKDTKTDANPSVLEKPDVPQTEVTEEKDESEKPVVDNDFKKTDKSVFIKCKDLAGKKLSLPSRTIEFDDNGKSEVTSEEAERLLTIPGYEIAK